MRLRSVPLLSYLSDKGEGAGSQLDFFFGTTNGDKSMIPNDHVQDLMCPQTMNKLQQDPRHTGKFSEVTRAVSVWRVGTSG